MKSLKNIYKEYNEKFSPESGNSPENIQLDINMVEGKTAFFPAGKGLYYEDGLPSKIDYMIIGQDFDTYENFKYLIEKQVSELHVCKEDNKRKNTTWTNLIKLLDGAGINKSSVFYTNAIMGYRLEDKNTGKSPAFKNVVFIEKCKKFMTKQIEHILPTKIIVLGANLFDFMADISHDLEPIKGTKKFKDLQHRLYKNVAFKTIPNYKCNVLFMLHPSLFYANARDNKELYLEELKALSKTQNSL